MLPIMNHSTKQKIWILVTPGSPPLDISGPFDVLREANSHTPGIHYEISLIGVRSQTVTTDSGMSIVTKMTLSEASRQGLPHTLIVAGGAPDFDSSSEEHELAQWLRIHSPKIPRICSVCSGAFVLGAAGLLCGRQATTHWSLLPSLKKQFIDTRVDSDALFVNDGPVWTSAGVTAGIDMSLALVEEDMGYEVSLAVARFLVLFIKRSGNQSQASVPFAGQHTNRRTLRELQAHIACNLSTDLSVGRLSEFANMSPRNFSRIFKNEFGIRPGLYVRNLRLDEAKRLLENTDLLISQIADEVGIGNDVSLRRWFSEHFGVSPKQYRERFKYGETDQLSD